jgi:transcriptional regulator with XRE-family HTH domain
MAQDSIQSTFLDQVRKRLPSNMSFVDELAEVLNVSRDSAYRRMRGETVLSLDEVRKICNHFKVSLDYLLSPAAEMVSFQLRALEEGEFTFRNFLKSVVENLEMISGFPDKHLTYHAKDLPIFHFFQYPDLARFKVYFWIKTFSPNAKFAGEKYYPEFVPHDLITIGERIWSKYANINSTEIISHEILNITLRQIQFAYDCSLIDRTSAKNLCEDCTRLLNHLREQAEGGVKNSYGTKDNGAKLDLYLNEVLIGDNSVFFKMADKRVTFITHNNFNILATSQELFCEMTEKHLINMMNKSTLISNSAAKERSRFFNELLEKVQRVKEKL